jgi:hypothetical protein
VLHPDLEISLLPSLLGFRSHVVFRLIFSLCFQWIFNVRQTKMAFQIVPLLWKITPFTMRILSMPTFRALVSRAVPFSRWFIYVLFHYLRAGSLTRRFIFALVIFALLCWCSGPFTRWFINRVSLRSFVIALDRLSLRGLLIIALAGILMRWTAYNGAGPLIIALDRLLLHWTANVCADPLIRAQIRLSVRRSAHPCADPLIHALIRLSVRRSAHPCADPLIHALIRLSVRWSAYPCADPLIRAQIRLSMRWSAYPCADPLIRAPIRLSMRRSA